MRSLQQRGVRVLAMETTDEAANYCEANYPLPEGVALVLGNEQIGVDTRVLAAVDGD